MNERASILKVSDSACAPHKVGEPVGEPSSMTMIKAAMETEMIVERLNSKVRRIGNILFGSSDLTNGRGDSGNATSVIGTIHQTIYTACETEDMLDKILDALGDE
ncbi:hypothetical protein [Aneurinibacillus migulanus]|uniref:Uncharacterized protein n=2 Tax=Aneurinibacillus migulanus TaxID=47500 RepID=A0A0D1VUY3_ANEMI|nr:hypothetical protein [Aneurinibacillus migulanus]KIV50065.1 hypothetical protein TS65_29860 [Aneurinibacillus migulanus]KON95226.1 hypothetical protein AF333_06780 [Aneurinibacillus migulanus]MED1619280.1 hypothetical protein [Aneurinibacillus migulanus]SDK32744.1 hypothetical protein SAMN04487909_14915 [Aneurinibacillus migulanus]GED16746.1 hypothetical protein AMI01nite_47370 [Aneurinibacillus migulanus]